MQIQRIGNGRSPVLVDGGWALPFFSGLARNLWVDLPVARRLRRREAPQDSEQQSLLSSKAARDDVFTMIEARLNRGKVACVFVDEAQFLTEDQVWQLARVVDDLGVPVMCYGLRVDFRGRLFPGSAALLAVADEMREVRTICHCGKKATMVVRLDENGQVLTDGDQVQIGGNETYLSLCRKHWRAAVGA